MPVPDFSPGEVLTAAAMDSIGLWLVKTQTIGAGVSSVTVTDAFSANYANYRILVTGGAGSAIASMRLTLGAAASGYYYGGKARTYAGTDLNIEGSNVAFWYAAETEPNGMSGSIELQNPQLETRTLFNTTITAPRAAGYWLSAGGYLDNNTRYTALTFTFSGGTQTGGTIRVYGYRN